MLSNKNKVITSNKKSTYIWFNLPEDIFVCNIIPYLRPTIKVWLSTTYYEKYHYIIKPLIPSNYYDSYVRDMIRHDCHYVLKQLLNENFEKWIKWKNYNFKNCVYTTYISFLLDYSCLHNSTKCKDMVYFFIEKSNVTKKEHKNNKKYISNQWSN